MRKHIGIVTTLALMLGVVGCQPAEEKKADEGSTVAALTPELKTTKENTVSEPSKTDDKGSLAMKPAESKPETSKPEVAFGAKKEGAKTPSEPKKERPVELKKETPQGVGKMITTASGLQYEDVVVGKGASPKPGQTVTVHYVGTLTNGTKFDASRDHGEPFSFAIGLQQVIAGWDEGVMSMKVGGKRKLTIPPALGYRDRAMGPIPANSTLLFEVELLKVE
jgi:peptidylprolyl isomerase